MIMANDNPSDNRMKIDEATTSWQVFGNPSLPIHGQAAGDRRYFHAISSPHIDRNLKDQTPDALAQRYTYIELVGAGATGKTFRAYDKLTGEHVAIKALRREVDFKTRELFDREVETLKSVDVKGVPKFIDFVESPDDAGEVYLVQEFVDGVSLQDIIREKYSKRIAPLRGGNAPCLFPEQAIRCFISDIAHILDALQTQYTPPIIHRDIKPSNILYDSKNDRFYRIDFGSVTNPQRKSLNSTIAGTQGYMAPEQLLGDATIQSDFYGLGATALHLATGVSPVDMPSDGFRLHCDDYVDGLKMSEELKALIKRLLAPSHSDRPQSAREILRIVEGIETKVDDKHEVEVDDNVENGKEHYTETFFASLIRDSMGDKCADKWLKRENENPGHNKLLFLGYLICVVFLYIVNTISSYVLYALSIREGNKYQDSKRVGRLLLGPFGYFLVLIICIFIVSPVIISMYSFLYLLGEYDYFILCLLNALLLGCIPIVSYIVLYYGFALLGGWTGKHLFQFRHTLYGYCDIPRLFLPYYLDDDRIDLHEEYPRVCMRRFFDDSNVFSLQAKIIATGRDELKKRVYIWFVYVYCGKSFAKLAFLRNSDIDISWKGGTTFGTLDRLIGRQIEVTVHRASCAVVNISKIQSDKLVSEIALLLHLSP